MFDFVGALNKLYREDPFVLALFGAVKKVYDDMVALLDEVKAQFFFDSLTILLPYYEKILRLTPKAGQSIDDRRSAVEARWKSKGHNSIELLQAVANSWMRGETQIDFVGGKLQVKFVSHYGVPSHLESLKEALDVVKPAHLPVVYKFKYLLIKDVRRMKIKDFRQHKISDFAAQREV